MGAVAGEEYIDDVRQSFAGLVEPGEIAPTTLSFQEQQELAVRAYQDPLLSGYIPQDPRDAYIYGPLPGLSDDYLRQLRQP